MIVPVYQAERYLPACLDSILAQTYHDLEIILVDDGSRDRSGAICDGYAARDRRVRVIHQKNSGASAARNAGLDAASGAYIGFVDADDYIEPDMYQTLHTQLTAAKADIAQCGYQYHREGEDGAVYGAGENGIYDSTQCIEKLLTYGVLWWTLWNKLFRAELFQDLRLSTELRVSEDMHMISQLFLRMHRLVFVRKPLYHYIWYSDSASKFSPHSVDAIKASRWILESLNQTIPCLSGLACRSLTATAVQVYEEFLTLGAKYDRQIRKSAMHFACNELRKICHRASRAAECTGKLRFKMCFIAMAPHVYNVLFPFWLKITKWRRRNRDLEP